MAPRRSCQAGGWAGATEKQQTFGQSLGVTSNVSEAVLGSLIPAVSDAWTTNSASHQPATRQPQGSPPPQPRRCRPDRPSRPRLARTGASRNMNHDPEAPSKNRPDSCPKRSRLCPPARSRPAGGLNGCVGGAHQICSDPSTRPTAQVGRPSWIRLLPAASGAPPCPPPLPHKGGPPLGSMACGRPRRRREGARLRAPPRGPGGLSSHRRGGSGGPGLAGEGGRCCAGPVVNWFGSLTTIVFSLSKDFLLLPPSPTWPLIRAAASAPPP